MPIAVVCVVSAIACAGAAWLLTPWARGIVDVRSRWLHRWVPTALGAIGGACAPLASDHPAVGVGLAALAVAAALLAPVDLASERLPDAIVLPALGVLLVCLVVAAATTGEWARLVTAVLASLAGGGAFLALALASPASLGLGDVKLALPLGLALGWHGWVVLLVGLAAGFALLAVAVLVLLAIRRTRRGAQVPFGPWMLLGAAAALGWAAAA